MFSLDGTFISASASPHCGDSLQERSATQMCTNITQNEAYSHVCSTYFQEFLHFSFIPSRSIQLHFFPYPLPFLPLQIVVSAKTGRSFVATVSIISAVKLPSILEAGKAVAAPCPFAAAKLCLQSCARAHCSDKILQLRRSNSGSVGQRKGSGR